MKISLDEALHAAVSCSKTGAFLPAVYVTALLKELLILNQTLSIVSDQISLDDLLKGEDLPDA